jgi:hypothetical protein
MPSWGLSEYLDACKNDKFYEGVKNLLEGEVCLFLLLFLIAVLINIHKVEKKFFLIIGRLRK